MITNEPELGKAFDEAAVLYDKNRPTYPSQLFDDLWKYAQLDETSKAVESGPGTGQATLELARRGLSIDAIEQGANLAALGRIRLQDYPKVTFHVSTFESVELPLGAYDLVFAATSFHWLDPTVRYEKAHQLLKPHGTLAVFWNQHIAHIDGIQDTFFYDAQKLYEQYDSRATPGSFHLSSASHVQSLTPEMLDSNVFIDVQTHQYLWLAEYTAESYTALLRTYSPTIAMPQDKREMMLGGIKELIEAKYGGRINKQYLATLDLARAR